MAYKISGKNRSLERLMPRGKDPIKAPSRMKYMHINPKGTTIMTPTVVARVSLPEEQKGSAIAVKQEVLDATARPAPEGKTVQAFDGEAAVDGPNYMVPAIDNLFFEPKDPQATFIVNANILRKILTVASEVTNDAHATTRIRFDKATNTLRFDTYRMPGEQEFTAVMKCMKYNGLYLPGEVDPNTPKIEQPPQQQNIVMTVSEGRKFRGEGE